MENDDALAPDIVVVVSADAEWLAVREQFSWAQTQRSCLGEWFLMPQATWGGGPRVIFFHGGWGKIAAAASAQYVISRWSPDLLVNLGTCGGFAGVVERGTVILAERTVVYDIHEQMGDPEEAVAHYSTDLDLGWLTGETPPSVQRGVLVSADRDLRAEEVAHLHRQYEACAGDWESGAIAYVAARNGVRCLILRGVTDLVGEGVGEAYGQEGFWRSASRQLMRELVSLLTTLVLGLIEKECPA